VALDLSKIVVKWHVALLCNCITVWTACVQS